MDGITEVQINGVSTNPIMMQLLVEGVLLLMECESAACAALTAEDKYLKLFSHLSLLESSNTLLSVMGDHIQTLGKVIIGMKLKQPFAVKTNKKVLPLMGRSWMEALIPSWRNVYNMIK